ncbi:hypothetical protein RN347_08835 [Halomonas sp. PAMB 3264]|uniref:hypothetical protein n=1 Tax=Halomonas sp. PAMB 3264 TaxID=3075222 RepID=UPI00289DF148|nr:hypothetical protein [Halomonas sp. PAMB 3264]WNL40752.1 hypothetical protein RN347_08835 [Halomonas sp. PAMB 3264]
MARIELWIVTVASGCSIGELADRLGREGLTVRELMEEIGCITGEADSATAERIRHIDGVEDIAPDIPFELGPMDSDTRR